MLSQPARSQAPWRAPPALALVASACLGLQVWIIWMNWRGEHPLRWLSLPVVLLMIASASLIRGWPRNRRTAVAATELLLGLCGLWVSTVNGSRFEPGAAHRSAWGLLAAAAVALAVAAAALLKRDRPPAFRQRSPGAQGRWR